MHTVEEDRKKNCIHRNETALRLCKHLGLRIHGVNFSCVNYFSCHYRPFFPAPPNIFSLLFIAAGMFYIVPIYFVPYCYVVCVCVCMSFHVKKMPIWSYGIMGATVDVATYLLILHVCTI